MDIGNGQIYNDDCFNVFPKIADKSVDMVLCDLPYSRSASKWDKPLDLGILWESYKRIVKDDRAIVLFATQPFTTELISSNIEMFKYSWVWFKHSAPNFLNAKTMPLKVTEDICVFGFKPVSYNKKKEYMLYNPQFSQGKPYTCKSGKQKADTAIIRDRADAKSKMGGGDNAKRREKIPNDPSRLYQGQRAFPFDTEASGVVEVLDTHLFQRGRLGA